MIACPQCGLYAGALALVCPACNALVHGTALERLASEARAAEALSERRAIELWRNALQLLPVETKQHATIRARIATLESTTTPLAKHAGPVAGTWFARLGPLGLLLWKFKT